MKVGGIKFQLSSMMFIQYFIWGAWYVTLGAYLDKNVLSDGEPVSGVQIGMAYGTMAIASMISPIIVGMIADRYFSANRVMAFLNLVGAVLLFWLAEIKEFSLFFPVVLIYSICYMPTTTLANSISMANLQNPDKEFSRVRLLGSLGWIAACWVVSGLKIEDTNTIFYTSAAVSVFGTFFSLLLPYKAPEKTHEKATLGKLLGMDALGLLKQRTFATFMAFSVLACIPLAFYDSFTSVFMQNQGIGNIAAAMSLGQITEIFFLLTFPFFFAKLHYKGSTAMAMLVWVFLYGFFTLGSLTGNSLLIYAALPLHGFCFTFFFVTGQLFVEAKAPAHLKNSAQGLVAFATYGLGKWLGTFISGNVTEQFRLADGSCNWTAVWAVPFVIITLVLIAFWIVLGKKKKHLPLNE